MDGVVLDPVAERGIHKLVPFDGCFALERGGDHPHLEVVVGPGEVPNIDGSVERLLEALEDSLPDRTSRHPAPPPQKWRQDTRQDRTRPARPPPSGERIAAVSFDFFAFPFTRSSAFSLAFTLSFSFSFSFFTAGDPGIAARRFHSFAPRA
jgi:hypothetical protein